MERFYHEGDKILYIFLFSVIYLALLQTLALPVSGFKLEGNFAVPTVVNTLVEVRVAPCLDYCSSFIDGFCLFTFF